MKRPCLFAVDDDEVRVSFLVAKAEKELRGELEEEQIV